MRIFKSVTLCIHESVKLSKLAKVTGLESSLHSIFSESNLKANLAFNNLALVSF